MLAWQVTRQHLCRAASAYAMVMGFALSERLHGVAVPSLLP